MRTVKLTGKGPSVEYLFNILSKSYPDNFWTDSKKWYQSQTNHELTISNLTPEQIYDLGEKLAQTGVPVTLSLV